MRVLCYTRVSSVGQLEGDGPERQEEAMKAFCARHHLSILFLVEEAISGTTDGMDRPELAQFLEANAKRNPADPAYFDAIIVERLDRLARDLMVQEMLIREFQKLGIKLFATDQGELINLAEVCPDPTRKLIRQVMGAVAEYEKSNLVRKLASARARVKAAKGRCGGTIPYGVHLGEAPVLELMFSLREKMSLRSIADMLNGEGFRQRNGKPWTHSSVSNTLNNAERREK